MLQSERRLQKIGSSVLMSLPAEWIKTLGLKKGDILSIENNQHFCIFGRIHPKMSGKK